MCWRTRGDLHRQAWQRLLWNLSNDALPNTGLRGLRPEASGQIQRPRFQIVCWLNSKQRAEYTHLWPFNCKQTLSAMSALSKTITFYDVVNYVGNKLSRADELLLLLVFMTDLYYCSSIITHNASASPSAVEFNDVRSFVFSFCSL